MLLYDSWGRNTWGWILWGMLALFVVLNRSLIPVEHADVFLIYRDGALKWLQGQPLYDGSGTGFIYFPQAAVLFTPFTQLPVRWDSMIWRLVNIGGFAVGVYGFTRLASRRYDIQLFLPVTIVSILMGASAAKLGQATLIMAGLMMIAVMSLSRKNWWRAAIWLVMAFTLKPLVAVLILLVAVLYPRTIIPLLAGLAVFILAPFLMQDIGYVWDQYHLCLATIKQVTVYGQENPFAQLFWMLKSAGINTPEAVQVIIRLLFAALTLGFCWWLRGKQTPHTFTIYLYSLAACYVLLFNPRTENNTYAILGPAVGVFAVWSFQSTRRLGIYSYSAIVAFYLLSNRIGKWLIGAPTFWIKPLLCLMFLILVVNQSRLDHDKS